MAGVPVPQIQDAYLQKLQGKFGWAKQRGDTREPWGELLMAGSGLFFGKDKGPLAGEVSHESAVPLCEPHQTYPLQCLLCLFFPGADRDGPGPFVCPYRMSVW